MECPKCGARLSEKDFCTACGEDVGIYKRVVKISNSYYNDGLEKAKVRDLSGAIESLKRSLKYYKKNMMARNLLGLVYYEIGEIVEALSQWVVSCHYQKEKNIANDYLKAVQSNPGQLEEVNQTIRKYNQALLYCQQGSDDMAIIQLKKVLAMNSRMIQAYQLLGLLYISTGEYDQARRTLNRALKIDTTNTRTLRYLRETRQLQKETETTTSGRIRRNKEQTVSYRDGNETIIQPISSYKETSGVSTLVNILIGLVIGLAVAWFLIIPARQEAIKDNYKEQNISLGEELATKNAEANAMKEEIETLKADVERLNGQVSEYETGGSAAAAYEALIKAANAHLAGDGAAALASLNGITVDGMSEEVGKLYQTLTGGSTGDSPTSQNLAAMKQEATNLYKAKNYTEAAAKLKEVLAQDPNDLQCLYYLGRSYQMDESLLAEPERTEQIKALFSKIIELNPNSSFAGWARGNMPQ